MRQTHAGPELYHSDVSLVRFFEYYKDVTSLSLASTVCSKKFTITLIYIPLCVKKISWLPSSLVFSNLNMLWFWCCLPYLVCSRFLGPVVWCLTIFYKIFDCCLLNISLSCSLFLLSGFLWLPILLSNLSCEHLIQIKGEKSVSGFKLPCDCSSRSPILIIAYNHLEQVLQCMTTAESFLTISSTSCLYFCALPQWPIL